MPRSRAQFDHDLFSCSPDRWDDLPAAVRSAPGLWANLMTFGAGPRVSDPRN